jgi:membrane carboxypeptidase/penicillin-binding protein
VVVLLLVALALAVAYPNLPDINSLADYRPKLPLRVYSSDGVLLGEFGEERRTFMPIASMPQVMKDAVLAAEDARFYQHGGVDYKGVARAALENLRDARSQGASTITMQVARNFYLSTEKTFTRKIYEILLALKIESLLSKDQILELYMNQIFLGQRANGFAAAAEIYFGKKLGEVSVAEAAMLAGLPKAPSAYNPIANPRRATQRQRYIIDRMFETGFITEAQHDEALAQVLRYRTQSEGAVHAEFVAEAARQLVFAQYGDDTYTRGLNVHLTVTAADQIVAYKALRKGLMDYELRQVYRGPEAYVDLPADAELIDARVAEALAEHPDNDELRSAVVLEASPRKVVALLQSGDSITVTGEGLRPVTSGLSDKAGPKIQIRRGCRGARDAQRQGGLGADPAARSRRRHGGDGAAHRRHPRDGRRLRLQQEQVQPRHPGLAAAGLQLQALHLLGGAGKGLHAGHRGQRCAAVLQRRRDGQPALGAQELRRQVRRPDAAADGAGQVQEHGLDPRSEVHRPGLRAGMGRELRLRPRQAPGLPDDGAGRRLGHAAADGHGLQRVCQRRLPPAARAHPARHRQQGPRAAGNPAARAGREPAHLPARNAFVMGTLLQEVARSGTAARAQALLKRTDLYGKTGTTNDSWTPGLPAFSPG